MPSPPTKVSAGRCTKRADAVRRIPTTEPPRIAGPRHLPGPRGRLVVGAASAAGRALRAPNGYASVPHDAPRIDRRQGGHVRFGLFYLPTYPSSLGPAPAGLLRQIVDESVLAEELGFTGVWLAEHHFHGFGGVLSNPAGVGIAITARTRRLRVGTAVTQLPYHHPLRLAEDYATLDVLSEGRLDFGVGTGFLRWENEIWDAPLETAREKFAESLDVILRVWQEENVGFEGQFVSFPSLTLLPRPYQQPHPPIWYAATTTPESFVKAGERGYHLMLIPFLHDVADLREKVQLYRDALRAAGHDPSSREILAAYHVYVGADGAPCRDVAAAGLAAYVGASGEIHART